LAANILGGIMKKNILLNIRAIKKLLIIFQGAAQIEAQLRKKLNSLEGK